MPPKSLKKLTPDEAALLPIAARLEAIVRQYAALPPPAEQMQVFWNNKVVLELVCCL
jgi:hypothetical protein